MYDISRDDTRHWRTTYVTLDRGGTSVPERWRMSLAHEVSDPNLQECGKVGLDAVFK